MNPDSGKRYIYVSLFRFPTAKGLNQIRVDLLGCGLPYRLGFYNPFSDLPMFWDPVAGKFDSVGKDGQVDSGDALLTSRCRFQPPIYTKIEAPTGFRAGWVWGFFIAYFFSF